MNGGIVTDSTGSQCSLPVGFPALDNKEHLLAVRYQKNDIQKFFDAGFSAGFGIQLGNANYLVNKRVSQLNEVYYKMILFGIIPLILASFHLIIFFFNHNNKQNLFYGLCMIGFAGIVFAANIGVVTNNYTLLIIYNQASYFFENMAIVFGLLLMYSFTGTRTPRHAWFIIFIAACLTLFAFRPFILSKYQDIFLALVIVEMVRKAFFTKNEGGNGSYVILIGFLILVVSLILQLLIVYDVIPQFFGFGNGYLYGALSLGISMSIHLSLNFAKINKDLQKQLRQISDLSEKTLAQERDAHRKEIEQRLLEADHARKTEELDGARQLQLSMLPTTLPVIPGLDIAVYLNTATEVGGDYYDFHLQENGTLTVAVGDATGHGVKAGILVAVTKGLFHEMASISDIPTMFRKLTTVIKTMNLGQLFMSMALLKLQKETFTLSSAGMPPVLVYRAKEGSVEEIRLKGMPLGAFANFNYTQISNSLFPGDALVIMSDGFPEMFNQQKEQFGFERTKSALQNVGTKTAEQIISHFTDCTAKWLGSESQADDITFVVIKKIDQPTE
jgi:serine phosphatase RsbU (regulator of sigma subunit)